MAELRDPEVWENGGNVVSFEQKRRELVARQEQERVEYNISGEGPTTPLSVLSCYCGCEALITFTDGEHIYTECMECGEPMILPLLTFLSGQD